MLTRAGLRAFSTESLKVVNDVAKQRFVAYSVLWFVVSMKGAEAELSYETSGNKITFVYTEVPKEFQGKGVGKILAKYAFDHALDKKLQVICKCHFLAKFYENNKSQYKPLKVEMQLEN